MRLASLPRGPGRLGPPSFAGGPAGVRLLALALVARDGVLRSAPVGPLLLRRGDRALGHLDRLGRHDRSFPVLMTIRAQQIRIGPSRPASAASDRWLRHARASARPTGLIATAYLSRSSSARPRIHGSGEPSQRVENSSAQPAAVARRSCGCTGTRRNRSTEGDRARRGSARRLALAGEVRRSYGINRTMMITDRRRQ